MQREINSHKYILFSLLYYLCAYKCKCVPAEMQLFKTPSDETFDDNFPIDIKVRRHVSQFDMNRSHSSF